MNYLAATALTATEKPKHPSFYADANALSYATQWKTELRNTDNSGIYVDNNEDTPIIFGLTFFESYLIGCNSTGEVLIWKLSSDDSETTNVEEYTATTPDTVADATLKDPVVRLPIGSSTTVLYACKMVEIQSSSSCWLMVSGDHGVSVFDWDSDIFPRLATKRKSNCTSTKDYKTFPSPSELSIEINDFCIKDKHLYGASGDGFGCYKWDLETQQVVTTYKSKKGGYLHTVDSIPHSNLLLSGGEDGNLEIWDTRQDLRVDCIDAYLHRSSKPVSTNNKRKSADTMDVGDHQWVSCARAKDETWWVAAGGKGSRGYISTFHGPTRSMISTVESQAQPQQLVFGDHTSMVTVGNESFLTKFSNFLDLTDTTVKAVQHAWCNQKSAYAVAVSDSGQRVATGGVGPSVDIFENGTQHGIQLSTR